MIQPWAPGNLELLRELLGDPVMMEYLGGPESDERIARRQADYEQPGSLQYRIVDGGEGAGWIGLWEREWRGETVYEIGWSVLPRFQGRGLASAATRALLARADRRLRYVHAFPSVDNAPSNAICRKAGFELLGTCECDYPPGSSMRCNDWRYDLQAS